MEKIKVLDHGEVALVEKMGSDLSIVRNARHSYNEADQAGVDQERDEKLIRYLMNNGHNTPFESVTLTLYIKAPIFVIRQWHRHRTQSYNEISARYRKLPAEFYIPTPENVGIQSKHNKQMRDIEKTPKDVQSALELMKKHNEVSFKVYDILLENEIPRELARTVLPLATYTCMFATMNLHNLFRFLGERLHEHAQWEIQQYAQAVLKLIGPVFPVTTKAFKDSLV